MAPHSAPTAPTAPTASITTHSPPHLLHNLALQTLHNLQYQHDWSFLIIHTHSPLTRRPLPRPLVSGLPPRRIYVHPDQQVEELKSGVKEDEVEVEREWVLPTHLAEKWSLRGFAELFDAVGEEPPGEGEDGMGSDGGARGVRYVRGMRRGGKRVLLATVGDDSTLVYYIMHDGIVKPRQN